MPRCKISAFLLVFLAVLPVGSASGQSVKEWRAAEEGQVAPTPKARVDQTYEGVVPGSGNTLPRVEELKNKAGTWVTWPGFMMREDGGSRVFIQTTVEVTYKLSRHKNTVLIRLKDAAVHLTNNRNPLVTTNFNTPLSRAYLKKKRKTLDLVLELKKDALFDISQNLDQDGYHYMFIDFPPGAYPTIEPLRPSAWPASKDETADEDSNS